MPNQTVSYFIDFIKKSHRLKPKEIDVLVRRLKRKKLKTIGRKYKLSYERIRQIEKSGLSKLSKKEFQELLFDNWKKNIYNYLFLASFCRLYPTIQAQFPHF